MPSRIIRESILTSDRVEQLDVAQEVFYRRLLSRVDDYGLYDARLSILRATLYPLRLDRVREADISRWIAACEKAGLIALYTFDGKPYLQALNTRWTARSEAKYPTPPWGLEARDGEESPDQSASPVECSPENSCKQVNATVPVVLDVDVVSLKPAREAKPELSTGSGPPKPKPAGNRLPKVNGNPNGKTVGALLGEWWKTPAGIEAQGRALHLPAKVGESAKAYKERLFAAQHGKASA
jgi:hypothetical protein